MRQTLHESLLMLIYMGIMAEPERAMHRGLTPTAACICSLVIRMHSLLTNIDTERYTNPR